jgi:lipopolysaccharide biosynthesis regulator YciM
MSDMLRPALRVLTTLAKLMRPGGARGETNRALRHQTLIQQVNFDAEQAGGKTR